MIKAAAWAAPVVAVAASAPLAAASIVPPGFGSSTGASLYYALEGAVAVTGGNGSYFAVQTDASGGTTGLLDVRFYPPAEVVYDADFLSKFEFRLEDGTVLANPGAGQTAQVPGNAPWYYTYDQGSNGAWRLSLYYPEQSRTDAGVLGPYYIPRVELQQIDGSATPISTTNQVSNSKGSSNPALNFSGVTYFPAE